MQQPTIVVLADLPAEQQAWFEPLTRSTRLVFGSQMSAIREELARAEGLFVWGHPRDPFEHVIAAAPRLRWVHSTGAGVEHLLVPNFVNSPVVLTNSRGAHTSAVAELAMTFMLALAKHVPDQLRAQREHQWQQQLNRQVSGATVLLVGLGSIGSAIARAACALDMRVLGVRRNARSARWTEAVVDFRHLEDVLPRAEYLVLCCPETAETRGLIGGEQLALLPQGAFLINVSRGNIVDEDALIDALRSRRLAGAGLDVFAREPLDPHSPLWDLAGVMLTPHFPNVRGWERPTVQHFLENAERFLEGRRLRNVVDKRRGY